VNVVTADPTLGPADSPADYEQLSTGWALGAAFGSLTAPGGNPSSINGILQGLAGEGEIIRGPHGEAHRNPDVTPLLAPDDANSQYGIPGQLTFSKPVREGEAKLLSQWKHEELQRSDALARSEPGIVPATARFLAGAAGSMMDPLNVAANFVPVLSEARWAAAAGKIGARSTRILRGAAEGLAGNAVAEPIVLDQAQNQQADYDAYDALKDLAFGAVVGAGLHGVTGEIGDLVRDWRRVPESTRDAALNQAVAAVIQGAPVRTAEIISQPIHLVQDYVSRESGALDPDRLASELGIEPQEAQRALGAMAAAGEIEYSPRSGKFRRLAQTGPLDAISFLQSKGGLIDTEGHDLALGRDAQRNNPRYGPLLRKSGMSIDEAGERLHEAGYFGDPTETPRPTEGEVLDLLNRSLAGERVYSIRDTGTALDQAGPDAAQSRDMAGAELDRAIDEHRLTVSEAERAAALDAMMARGLAATDALDSVLERTAIEGGLYTSPQDRLRAIQGQIEVAQQAGAPLHAIAPLLDERAAIHADLAAAATARQAPGGDVGEMIRQDLAGESPASLVTMEGLASKDADLQAKEAAPASDWIAKAEKGAADAEARFRAVVRELTPAEQNALETELRNGAEYVQAKRQAAVDLAGCMIREGV
jgi:hypothetical protein